MGGSMDSLTMVTFFDPEATYHGGEGKGRTPNWYYYWLQTSAGHGFTMEPARFERPCMPGKSDSLKVSHYDGYEGPGKADYILICDDAKIDTRTRLSVVRSRVSIISPLPSSTNGSTRSISTAGGGRRTTNSTGVG